MPEKEDDALLANTDAQLVAYRLGRVEKAVDQINDNSIARDEKMMEKLDLLGELASQVSRQSWQIESLEASRIRIYQFLAGVATVTLAILLQLIFRLV